jgi:hypothetical protein
MSIAGRVIVLLISMVLMSACTLKGTPRYSLAELKTALLNHDAGEAFKYVDVDSIVEHMVNDMFAQRESWSKTTLDAFGVAIGRGIASALLPEAKQLIRKEVRGAIESGGETGYFEQIRRASVWYLTIEEEGDVALVTPRRDDKVRFKMERSGEGYWKIKQIIVKNRQRSP